VLADEIGGPIAIGSLTFAMYDSGGPGLTTYHDFEVRMGLTDRDTLGAVFAANYIPGTCTVVMQAGSLTVEVFPDGEILLPLDVPYDFAADHNLLLEVAWSSREEEGDPIFAWNWITEGRRTVVGRYLSAGGTIYRDLAPWLELGDVSGLVTTSWGALKALAVL